MAEWEDDQYRKKNAPAGVDLTKEKKANLKFLSGMTRIELEQYVLSWTAGTKFAQDWINDSGSKLRAASDLLKFKYFDELSIEELKTHIREYEKKNWKDQRHTLKANALFKFKWDLKLKAMYDALFLLRIKDGIKANLKELKKQKEKISLSLKN